MSAGGAGSLEYYARRAREYDAVYGRPERQEDLRRLEDLVTGWTRGARVLELACGTGWWTERIARGAEHVVATDAGAEVLEIARHRRYPEGRVDVRLADAFRPWSIEGTFTCGLSGFWLSHVARAQVTEFLDTFHERLGRGARIVLFDNRFVEGSSTPVSRRDEAGDTYQLRRLESGAEYEVLKNFYGATEIRHFLRGRGTDVDLHELRYYWAVAYTVER